MLADRVVERKALTEATHDDGLEVDLTFVMAGFEFDQVWNERRVFRVEPRISTKVSGSALATACRS